MLVSDRVLEPFLSTVALLHQCGLGPVIDHGCRP